MSNGNGISRGDRNRNTRLSRLRVLVPVTNAIVGIDLADNKQMVVATDHDSKVLARRTFRCRAWVMPLIEIPQCCSSKSPTLWRGQVSGSGWF